MAACNPCLTYAPTLSAFAAALVPLILALTASLSLFGAKQDNGRWYGSKHIMHALRSENISLTHGGKSCF